MQGIQSNLLPAEPTPTSEAPRDSLGIVCTAKAEAGGSSQEQGDHNAQTRAAQGAGDGWSIILSPVTSEGGGHNLTFNTVVSSSARLKRPLYKKSRVVQKGRDSDNQPLHLLHVGPAWFCEDLPLQTLRLSIWSPFLPRSFTMFYRDVSVLVPINVAVTFFKTKL